MPVTEGKYIRVPTVEGLFPSSNSGNAVDGNNSTFALAGADFSLILSAQEIVVGVEVDWEASGSGSYILIQNTSGPAGSSSAIFRQRIGSSFARVVDRFIYGAAYVNVNSPAPDNWGRGPGTTKTYVIVGGTAGVQKVYEIRFLVRNRGEVATVEGAA